MGQRNDSLLVIQSQKKWDKEMTHYQSHRARRNGTKKWLTNSHTEPEEVGQRNDPPLDKQSKEMGQSNDSLLVMQNQKKQGKKTTTTKTISQPNQNEGVEERDTLSVTARKKKRKKKTPCSSERKTQRLVRTRKKNTKEKTLRHSEPGRKTRWKKLSDRTRKINIYDKRLYVSQNQKD